MNKNFLFSTALMAIATVASAQSLSQADVQVTTPSTEKVSVLKVKATTPIATSKQEASTRANGVSYLNPDGTYWLGINIEGAGYKADLLHVPALQILTFKNTSDEPLKTKWSINGNDVSQNVTSEGNLEYYYINPAAETDAAFYLPTLKSNSGNHSFTLGESNTTGSAVKTFGNAETTLCTTAKGGMTPIWSDTKGYIFGSDTEINETGEIIESIVVSSPQPAASLCVSNILYHVYSKSNTPLSSGAKMTLKIVEAKANDKGVYLPTDNVLYEMTAEEKDVLDGGLFSDLTTYALVFSNKVYDPATESMIEEPLTLDKPFSLVLSGFNQKGVDMGLIATQFPEGEVLNSHMTIPSEEGMFYGYGSFNVAVMITGYFNGIQVDDRINVLKAPDEGGIATATYEGGEIEYAAVTTSQNWIEEYDFGFEPELPSWISWELDNSYREEDGYYALTFTCEPSEGQDRNWTGHITGFGGVKSDNTITIYQGKYTGINDAVTNNNIKVSTNEDSFILSYMEGINNVNIVNIAGQTIATYELPASGQFTIPAANLSKGIYLLKFNNNQTIKVVK